MKVYSVKEVSEMLRVHHNTVVNLINEGTLKAFKIKRAFRITEESLNEFLKNNSVKTNNKS